MKVVRVEIHWKGVERFSDFTFAPGDTGAITIDGREVKRQWCDGESDPGVTVAQAEVLRDLVTDGAILEVGEDGSVTYHGPE